MESVLNRCLNYSKSEKSGLKYPLVLHEAHRLNPEHSKIIKARHLRVYQLIHDAIAQMESQGKINAPHKAFTSFAAIGMCSSTFYWFDYERRETVGQLSETFADLFFNGILNAHGGA